MGTKYNSDGRVREVIRAWAGNVQAAADALGVAPKNLRARLRTLQIDLTPLRAARPLPVRTDTHRYPPVRTGLVSGTGSQNAADTYRESTEESTLLTMQTAEADAPDLPIPTIRGQQKPTRLKPAQQDRLKAAKFDLQAAFRVETDENALLQAFFDETFDAWFEAKMAEKPVPIRKRAKDGEPGR